MTLKKETQFMLNLKTDKDRCWILLDSLKIFYLESIIVYII
jgi:hypothetical protein